MPQSLPSETVYVIDVPEIKNFKAVFEYNFFVPDEAQREVNQQTQDVIQGLAPEDNLRQFENLIQDRVPRYVKLTWAKPRLTLPGEVNNVPEDLRAGASSQNPRIISDNISKIVSEDSLSLRRYVDVTFSDTDIDEKLKELMSVGANILRPELPPIRGTGEVSENFDLDFVHSYVTQEDLNFDPNDTRDERRQQTNNAIMEQLKFFGIKASFDGKILPQILNTSLRDPMSFYKGDLLSLQSEAQNIAAQQQFDRLFANVVPPHVGIIPNDNSDTRQRLPAEIVGYVIDRFECVNGVDKELDPIIIENERVGGAGSGVAFDFKVKYGSVYKYRIKTIALFNLPAIDADTRDIAIMQLLVSSKPTTTVSIKIEDKVAPPPPSDTNFTWNYGTERLMVHWTFPPNPQRDIKKFQVFRRKNVNHPFELIKEYDFDDSTSRTPPKENIKPGISTRLVDGDNRPQPLTYYIDEDFSKESRHIYALCSIDAHGITSCYGPQFEVYFDKFKNQLLKKIVSHSGAPKAYPNLYLEGAGMVSSANVSGNHSKRMHLYFVPQFYYIKDENGRKKSVVATKQNGGQYKFLFLNVDNQKSETLTIDVDDLTTQ